MRDREIESCGAQSWSGSEKVRAKNKNPSARFPPETPCWVVNYDELLCALAGLSASPVSI